jgi:uncharacterized membrane protein HdeD (DUF308 family)
MTLQGIGRRLSGLGVALLVIGILAILFPLVASIAAKVMFGILLLLSGAAMLYGAFQSRAWGPALPVGLLGVVQVAAGVWLAFFPLAGLVALTFLLGVLFVLQGAGEIGMGLQARPLPGWLWLALSGVASAILGLLLILGLPGTALWAIGLIAGLNFVSSGLAFLLIGRLARI